MQITPATLDAIFYSFRLDFQAAYERALHARHAGGVRLRTWAGARRTGHGNTAAGVFAVQRTYLESLMAAATAIDQNPSSGG